MNVRIVVRTMTSKLKACTRNNPSLTACRLTMACIVGFPSSTNVLLCERATTILPTKTASMTTLLQTTNLRSILTTISPTSFLLTSTFLPTTTFLGSSSLLPFASIAILPSTLLSCPTCSTTTSSPTSLTLSSPTRTSP